MEIKKGKVWHVEKMEDGVALSIASENVAVTMFLTADEARLVSSQLFAASVLMDFPHLEEWPYDR